jgi:hypothetical protein
MSTATAAYRLHLDSLDCLPPCENTSLSSTSTIDGSDINLAVPS